MELHAGLWYLPFCGCIAGGVPGPRHVLLVFGNKAPRRNG
jgi:hypothetical protein